MPQTKARKYRQAARVGMRLDPYLLETLEHLARNGFVGRTKTAVANFLMISAIARMNEGKSPLLNGAPHLALAQPSNFFGLDSVTIEAIDEMAQSHLFGDGSRIEVIQRLIAEAVRKELTANSPFVSKTAANMRTRSQSSS